MARPLRTCAALGTALLVLAGLAADEPRDAAALVARLGSPRFAEREAAARALEALGPPALAPLRQAVQNGDAEVRRRARLLIARLERHAEAGRLLSPSRVRLVYTDVPLPRAAAELGRKTGFTVRLEGDAATLAERRLTLDTGAVPIWDAVDRFCQQAGLTERLASSGTGQDGPFRYDLEERRIMALRDYADETPALPENLVVLKEGNAPLPACQAGAVRVRALPAEARLPGPDKADGETLFGLEVRVEPRLRLQGVLALRVERATDEHGQTLIQPAAAVAQTGPFAGIPSEEVLIVWDGTMELPMDLPPSAVHVPVRLRLADKPSRQLRELRGTIAVQVQPAAEALTTVPGILQAAGRLVRGLDRSALRVIEVGREEQNRVRLRVEVVPPPDLMVAGVPAQLLLVNRGWWRGRGTPAPPPVRAEQLVLLDARGQKVPMVSSSDPAVGSGGKAWDYTLVFQPGPGQAAPDRLVYTARRAYNCEVPFRLTDIPLP